MEDQKVDNINTINIYFIVVATVYLSVLVFLYIEFQKGGEISGFILNWLIVVYFFLPVEIYVYNYKIWNIREKNEMYESVYKKLKIHNSIQWCIYSLSIFAMMLMTVDMWLNWN